jgi:hypothetical protein
VRISQILMDVIEHVLPLPKVPCPPSRPRQSQINDDAVLLEIRTAIQHIQAEQQERLLELYADVISGSARPDLEDFP